jgi:hypothetical protein
VLPKKIENWSLTSLQQRLVKTGGRLIKHARYYWLMLAESHLTRRLFGSMVMRSGSPKWKFRTRRIECYSSVPLFFLRRLVSFFA